MSRQLLMAQARRVTRALSLAAPLLLLGACAINHRPPTTVAALNADATALRAVDRATRDSVIERLVRRVRMRGDSTLDVLLLSGGGQNGSFGVGFLRAWSERRDMPMPTFDMVTGVSTGALQAPYALLGTPAALDTVTQLYRRAAERIAPSIDWLFWLRRTGGVVNTKRFDRALEESINGEFRTELRRAFADDRQMLFSTADYDLGIGRMWSMGDALDSTANGLARARQLLKAATAIPGIFPPVVVDGHVQGDGGIVTNVLAVLQYEDYQRLANRLAATGLRHVTINVYALMNIWTTPEIIVTPASNRKKISSRSMLMLFYSHQPETLANLDNMARAVTTTIPGLTMRFKVALLPAWLALEPGANTLFQKAFMDRLDALGAEKARSASPWDSIPSAFERAGRPPQ